jgi:hypothetical protein
MLMFLDEDAINLDNYSFEQWVAFVFDHPAIVRRECRAGVPREEKWYFQDEWKHWGSPEHLLPYMTRLFRRPEFLLERYTVAQLRQGFWYLSGTRVNDWLWDTDVAWRLRKKCIMAMAPLFKQLFVREQLEDTCYMWWDFFRSFSKKQDIKVKETMLLVMERILLLPSHECRAAALHGLGHLRHPRKLQVIRKFLRSHPELDDKWQSFAAAAIRGKVL